MDRPFGSFEIEGAILPRAGEMVSGVAKGGFGIETAWATTARAEAHDNMVAFFQVENPGTDGFDNTGSFVPKNDGPRAAPFGRRGFKVGMTHARCGQFDQNFAFDGAGKLQGLNRSLHTGITEYGCLDFH